jgi:hypothetical protein
LDGGRHLLGHLELTGALLAASRELGDDFRKHRP